MSTTSPLPGPVPPPPNPADDAAYAARVSSQIRQYEHVENMHQRPDIHGWWSARYLRPRIQQVFGVPNHLETYAKAWGDAARSDPDRPARFASLGCGDGMVEIDVAKRLRRDGVESFVIEAFELSEHQIGRVERNARDAGMDAHIRPIQADLNQLALTGTYTGVMAHHSLHHIVDLEHVFDQVHGAIGPDGVFVSFDMIGRNGHMRWPEMLALLEPFWRLLPDRIKRNTVSSTLDPAFVNLDCSTSGFEGIRAQDILPLLVERFGFTHFLGYGGLVDPFIGRLYAANLDGDDDHDRALIDFLEHLNDLLIDLGHLKPTKMGAVMTTNRDASAVAFRDWSPAFCVRPPTPDPPTPDPSGSDLAS